MFSVVTIEVAQNPWMHTIDLLGGHLTVRIVRNNSISVKNTKPLTLFCSTKVWLKPLTKQEWTLLKTYILWLGMIAYTFNPNILSMFYIKISRPMLDSENLAWSFNTDISMFWNWDVITKSFVFPFLFFLPTNPSHTPPSLVFWIFFCFHFILLIYNTYWFQPLLHALLSAPFSLPLPPRSTSLPFLERKHQASQG